MDYSDVEGLIEKCLAEISEASEGGFDVERASKAAALCLKTQMKLAYMIEQIELQSRGAKNEIARIEGEKYFEIKNAATAKLTDAALTASLAKEPDVLEAKRNFAKDESSYKKWLYLSNTLKESHVFFRGMSRE